MDGIPIWSWKMEPHQPKTNAPPPLQQTERNSHPAARAGNGSSRSSGRIRCGKVGVKLRWKNLVCIPTVIEQEKLPGQNRWEGRSCQKQKQHRPGAIRWTSVVSSNSRTIEKPTYWLICKWQHQGLFQMGKPFRARRCLCFKSHQKITSCQRISYLSCRFSAPNANIDARLADRLWREARTICRLSAWARGVHSYLSLPVVWIENPAKPSFTQKKWVWYENPRNTNL
jgi:hypothetical protein